MKRKITRRDFMKSTSAVVMGAALGLSVQTQEKKSRVVLIRHRNAVDENSKLNPEIIQQMLDEAVMNLLDERDPIKAFQKLLKPGEVIGVKTNVWSYLPTPPEVEAAIKRRVLDCGIEEEDISFDDHNCRTNPVFQRATSLINVRPLRTHYLSGMSGCMKNYIMFAESQVAYHPNSCANLGTLFNLPMVKGKTRLNILVALTPQFHGRGPHHFSRRYVWSYKGIIVGQDPVAVDATALRIIMAKRSEVLGKARAFPPVAKHIEIADKKHKIGTSDPKKIDLIKLGWKEDILIT